MLPTNRTTIWSILREGKDLAVLPDMFLDLLNKVLAVEYCMALQDVLAAGLEHIRRGGGEMSFPMVILILSVEPKAGDVNIL